MSSPIVDRNHIIFRILGSSESYASQLRLLNESKSSKVLLTNLVFISINSQCSVINPLHSVNQLTCKETILLERKIERGSTTTKTLFLSVLINQFVPPTFCLCFVFTCINFQGMLHTVCDMAYDKNLCGPIRTRKCRSTNLLINYMFYSPF